MGIRPKLLPWASQSSTCLARRVRAFEQRQSTTINSDGRNLYVFPLSTLSVCLFVCLSVTVPRITQIVFDDFFGGGRNAWLATADYNLLTIGIAMWIQDFVNDIFTINGVYLFFFVFVFWMCGCCYHLMVK